MLNPIAILAKHYMRRALQGYRRPVMFWTDEDGSHVLLRSPIGEGHPYGYATDDGHLFSVFVSDASLAIGHRPPGEQWRNKAEITRGVYSFGDGMPDELRNRVADWPNESGQVVAYYDFGPIFFRANTVANQRRHYAEYCVKQSTKQAKAPA